MLKLLYIPVLAAMFFRGAVADPDPQSHSAHLERRDTASFFATQVALQNAANVLAQDGGGCCLGTSPTPPIIAELELIATHIKACSDAFDNATIQLASIFPGIGSSGVLSAEDAATLNTTFVPSTQAAILNTLDGLQSGKAFFEFVNNNRLLLTMYCHWVHILSLENASFLGLLVLAAPSADYSSYWGSLESNAAFQYNIWLTEDGFNCGGI
ncbi:hypothetical protein DFH06DRAFT_504936 [Mycena polygramma]|nr:hypothetical protein DFH06DRAFT_504936 [Mycena polygramma]